MNFTICIVLLFTELALNWSKRSNVCHRAGRLQAWSFAAVDSWPWLLPRTSQVCTCSPRTYSAILHVQLTFQMYTSSPPWWWRTQTNSCRDSVSFVPFVHFHLAFYLCPRSHWLCVSTQGSMLSPGLVHGAIPSEWLVPRSAMKHSPKFLRDLKAVTSTMVSWQKVLSENILLIPCTWIPSLSCSYWQFVLAFFSRGHCHTSRGHGFCEDGPSVCAAQFSAHGFWAWRAPRDKGEHLRPCSFDFFVKIHCTSCTTCKI